MEQQELAVSDSLATVNELAGLLDEGIVGEKDKGFAESLVAQCAKKGHLSEKQMHWVGVLIERAVVGEPEPDKMALGNFAAMIELFDKAKAHLKFPKIWLQAEGPKYDVELEDGSMAKSDVWPIRLSVAGAKAKNPGSINVTDGEPFGYNQWYGRILTDGFWEQPMKQPAELQSVAKVLEAFADDPVGVAAAHGHLTGHCCFCNRKLEDEKSTSVGYGPVCAKHYGLPWGKKS